MLTAFDRAYICEILSLLLAKQHNNKILSEKCIILEEFFTSWKMSVEYIHLFTFICLQVCDTQYIHTISNNLTRIISNCLKFFVRLNSFAKLVICCPTCYVLSMTFTFTLTYGNYNMFLSFDESKTFCTYYQYNKSIAVNKLLIKSFFKILTSELLLTCQSH
jgi:hypothetical protein